jgi:AraC-like DNA-binding protein
MRSHIMVPAPSGKAGLRSRPAERQRIGPWEQALAATPQNMTLTDVSERGAAQQKDEVFVERPGIAAISCTVSGVTGSRPRARHRDQRELGSPPLAKEGLMENRSGRLAPNGVPVQHRERRAGAIDVPMRQDPELLRRLLRAKDRMDACSHEDWRVRRLARVSGVSEAHFARAFKKAFGLPPHRYLLTRRLERAKALLRDTDLTITEIAFQTGWSSLGTFGRTFRDVTGETPGGVRARARAAAHDLGRVPACFVSAAHRPALTTAVSEKRRLEQGGRSVSRETEVS